VGDANAIQNSVTPQFVFGILGENAKDAAKTPQPTDSCLLPSFGIVHKIHSVNVVRFHRFPLRGFENRS
jgi:hypothetical protein